MIGRIVGAAVRMQMQALHKQRSVCEHGADSSSRSSSKRGKRMHVRPMTALLMQSNRGSRRRNVSLIAAIK